MGLVAAEAAGAAADSAVVAGDHRMGPAVAARQAEEDRMAVVDRRAEDRRAAVVRRLAGLRAAVVVHTDTKAVWAHRVDETRCLEHIKSGRSTRAYPRG
jgi:hypothetical protein